MSGLAFVIGINPPDTLDPEVREDLRLPAWKPHTILGSYEGDDAIDAAQRHADMLAAGSAARFYAGFLVAAEVTQ